MGSQVGTGGARSAAVRRLSGSMVGVEGEEIAQSICFFLLAAALPNVRRGSGTAAVVVAVLVDVVFSTGVTFSSAFLAITELDDSSETSVNPALFTSDVIVWRRDALSEMLEMCKVPWAARDGKRIEKRVGRRPAISV